MARYKKGDYFKKIKGKSGRKNAWTKLVTFSGKKYKVKGHRKGFDSFHGAKTAANRKLARG